MISYQKIAHYITSGEWEYTATTPELEAAKKVKYEMRRQQKMTNGDYQYSDRYDPPPERDRIQAQEERIKNITKFEQEARIAYGKKLGKYNEKDPYITNTNVKTYKNQSDFEHNDTQEKLVLGPGEREKLIPKNVWKSINFHLNRNTGEGAYSQNVAKYFDRLYSVSPQHEIDSLCQYVFIVRPDLNILDDDTNKLINAGNNRAGWKQNSSPHKDKFFAYMNHTYPYVLANLTGGWLTKHDFMPYLVGRTLSLSLPAYTLKDYNMNQPFTNYNLPYASNALASQTGGTFEISFREDINMKIHKLFQTWVYYIDGVVRNKFSPKIKYIRDNRIDYASSIYCITCKADASEIVHWTKYTGCFPTSVPNDDFSFNLRGEPKKEVTIPFDYFYVESLNPYILVDFNKNAHIENDSSKTPYIPIYSQTDISKIGLSDKRTAYQKQLQTNCMLNARSDGTGLDGGYRPTSEVVMGTGNRLVGCPFIVRVGKKYYLRWKRIKDLTPY